MIGVTLLTPPADLTQFLARSPLFRGLPAAHLEAVRQAARCRQVERDAFFFHQGDLASAVYLLTEGEAKLTWVTPEGYQMLVRFVTPGEELGVCAVTRDAVYMLSAQAVQDCLALAWEGQTLAQLVEAYPHIAFNLLDLVAGHYARLLDRYQELITARVEQRLARALIRLAGQAGQQTPTGVLIDLPLSRVDLAEMTGTTIYTASRVLSRWEHQGLVETGREWVLVRQPSALAAVAEDMPPIPPSEDLPEPF
jgi:CRP-like cAMP-binding protein